MMKLYLRVLMGLILAVGLAHAEPTKEISVQVGFLRSDVSFERLNGYDVIKVSGCYLSHEVGAPLLPVKNVYVVLPSEATVTGVEVISVTSEDLPGTYDVYPAQPSIPISQSDGPRTWVEPDDSLYNSPEPYPADRIRYTGTGYLGGEKIASLQIYPIQYTPNERVLRLFSSMELKLKCTLTGKTLPKVNRTETTHRIYRDVVVNVVLNPEDVRQERPHLSDNGILEYLIVTSSTLASAFQRLADWKTKKGVPAEIETVEWITSHVQGRDVAEAIREYIRTMVHEYGTAWVLLGGDTEVIPCRHTHIEMETCAEDIPSDLYYSDLDGDWDADEDGVFGEPEDNVDFYPDVWVGRAPVTTPSEAQTFVDKVLGYELTVPVDYQCEALFFAEFGDPLTDKGIAKDMIHDRYFPLRFDPITKLYERDGTEDAAAVLAAMNDGYNLLNHSGHAWIGVLSTGPDRIRIEDVDGLYNAPRLSGVLYSVGCWPAAIDDDCIAEHWVKNPHGGGFFVGNSRYGWYTPSFPGYGSSALFDQQFFSCLFTDDVYQIGATLAGSKIRYIADAYQENDYRWIEYSLNLLGDPELPLWTDIPELLDVDHPSTIPVGASGMTVTVTHLGSPVPDALVCGMKGEETYCREITGLDGQVALSVVPSSPGILQLTATAHNFLPYEDEVDVVADGPYVSYDSHTSDDTDGNNDGIVNPGETIRLCVRLRNDGTTLSPEVTAVLSTSDPWVTIIDGQEEYGDIGPGAIAECPDGCTFSVLQDCPNAHVVYFQLDISDTDGHVWPARVGEVVSSPIIVFTGRTIYDDTDGNGLADPGEQIDLLVNVENVGLGNATTVRGWLSATDPYVIPISNSSDYPDICPGERVSSSSFYTVLIHGSCPTPHEAGLALEIECDGYSGVETFTVPVGLSHFFDSCESGVSEWTHHGSIDAWHLTSHRNHTPGGSHCWYCGTEGTWLYPPNFTCHLVSPPIVLGSNPALTLWSWSEIESGMDYAFIEVDAGAGWQELGMLTGYSNGWVQKSYDLSQFSGTTAQVRFTFFSDDDAAQYEGWYIDDVAVQVDAIRPEKGDVNGDGTVNIIDIVRLINIILEIGDPPNQGEIWAGDCDGDGDLDIMDVIGIVNVLLGFGVCPPSPP